MEKDSDKGLPFTTRKMLAFENGKAFSLSITLNGPTAGEVAVRGFTKEGFFNLKVPIVSAGVSQTNTLRIPDIPVFVSVVDSLGTMTQGQCFAALRLQIDGTNSYELCSGWVYKNKSLSYPSIQNAENIPGRGHFATIAPAGNPAVGAEVSFTLAAGYVYHILGFRVSLTAGPTIGTRRVKFGFTISGNDHYYMTSLVDQAATDIRQYYGNRRAGWTAVVGTTIGVELADELWAAGGDTFFTNTVNLKADDQFSAIELVVERFIFS